MRERIVLATKTFNPMAEGEDSGLSAGRIRRQIAASLTRLGVDRVPLYLCHAMDPDVPVAETVGTFEQLAEEGTIQAYGGSNVDAAWLEEALRHGRPAWAQNSYSLLEREDEQDAIRVCVREGLAYTPYSPLAGGWLTGKYRRGEEPPAGSRMTLRPGPVPALPGRPGLRRARGVRAARGPAGNSRRPRSPSPGCSAIRT